MAGGVQAVGTLSRTPQPRLGQGAGSTGTPSPQPGSGQGAGSTGTLGPAPLPPAGGALPNNPFDLAGLARGSDKLTTYLRSQIATGNFAGTDISIANSAPFGGIGSLGAKTTALIAAGIGAIGIAVGGANEAPPGTGVAGVVGSIYGTGVEAIGSFVGTSLETASPGVAGGAKAAGQGVADVGTSGVGGAALGGAQGLGQGLGNVLATSGTTGGIPNIILVAAGAILVLALVGGK